MSYILDDVRDLGKATSQEIFLAFSTQVLNKWRTSGESAFANWFEETYLAEDWRGWFPGMGQLCGLAGIGVTNNSLESLNRTIKLLVLTVIVITSTSNVLISSTSGKFALVYVLLFGCLNGPRAHLSR